MTEREEDEELLLEEKDEIEESGVIKRFSDSPYCEWILCVCVCVCVCVCDC